MEPWIATVEPDIDSADDASTHTTQIGSFVEKQALLACRKLFDKYMHLPELQRQLLDKKAALQITTLTIRDVLAESNNALKFLLQSESGDDSLDGQTGQPFIAPVMYSDPNSTALYYSSCYSPSPYSEPFLFQPYQIN